MNSPTFTPPIPTKQQFLDHLYASLAMDDAIATAKRSPLPRRETLADIVGTTPKFALNGSIAALLD